jgi:hypothetical protein
MSSFFAVCHGLNDKCLHDFEKKNDYKQIIGGGGGGCSLPVATALNFETTFTETLYANGANLP